MPWMNLTPHAVTLRGTEGTDTVIPPSGVVTRVTSTPGVFEGLIEGVEVYGSDQFGDVEDLPLHQEGTRLLVSFPVGAALAGTTRARQGDIFTLGTGPADNAVRNEKGHPVAVTRVKRVK